MTTFTPLPVAPQRTDDPTTFANRADAFVAALAVFQAEAAVILGEVNAALATNGVPALTGNSLQLLRANSAENALEFAAYNHVTLVESTTNADYTFSGSGFTGTTFALDTTLADATTFLRACFVCTTADAGWSVDDIVPVENLVVNDSTNSLVVYPSVSAGSISSVAVQTKGTPQIISKSNGDITGMTSGSWSIRLIGVSVAVPT